MKCLYIWCALDVIIAGQLIQNRPSIDEFRFYWDKCTKMISTFIRDNDRRYRIRSSFSTSEQNCAYNNMMLSISTREGRVKSATRREAECKRDCAGGIGETGRAGPQVHRTSSGRTSKWLFLLVPGSHKRILAPSALARKSHQHSLKRWRISGKRVVGEVGKGAGNEGGGGEDSRDTPVTHGDVAS